MKPKDNPASQRAWELHKMNGHPVGYDGPCWGPTSAEKEQAKKETSK